MSDYEYGDEVLTVPLSSRPTSAKYHGHRDMKRAKLNVCAKAADIAGIAVGIKLMAAHRIRAAVRLPDDFDALMPRLQREVVIWRAVKENACDTKTRARAKIHLRQKILQSMAKR